MKADLMLLGCVRMAFSCKCLVSMRVAGTLNEESCICRRNFGPQISRGMTLIISRVGDDGGQI